MRKASIVMAVLCLGAAVFAAKCLSVLYDGVTGWRGFLDVPALGTTALAVVASLWVLRKKWRANWLWVGIGCLAAMPAVCLAQWLALVGSPAFETGGPWLRTTLLGTLYPALCCTLFAMAEAVTATPPGRMIFQEPSGMRLPDTFNPLVWREMIQ